jgi:hypothetical protein
LRPFSWKIFKFANKIEVFVWNLAFVARCVPYTVEMCIAADQIRSASDINSIPVRVSDFGRPIRLPHGRGSVISGATGTKAAESSTLLAHFIY